MAASATRLSPRLFGEPVNRTRAWRILYDPKKMHWNCVYSFAELVEIFLLPHGTPLRVGPTVYLSAPHAELEKYSKKLEDLSPSENSHLEKFKQKCPDKVFFDLAQNPDYRRRTETADGALMTLTTNTHIWHPGNASIE